MSRLLNHRNHSAGVRQKIRTTQIINRLQDYFEGKVVRGKPVELTTGQIRTAEILLSKTVPNLASIESFNQTEVSVISTEPITESAWAKMHAELDQPDDMGEPEGNA